MEEEKLLGIDSIDSRHIVLHYLPNTSYTKHFICMVWSMNALYYPTNHFTNFVCLSVYVRPTPPRWLFLGLKLFCGALEGP